MSTAIARGETYAEAAARWNVHPKTIARMVGRRRLTAYRIGRAVRLDPAEVDAAFRVPAREPVGAGRRPTQPRNHPRAASKVTATTVAGIRAQMAGGEAA